MGQGQEIHARKLISQFMSTVSILFNIQCCMTLKGLSWSYGSWIYNYL